MLGDLLRISFPSAGSTAGPTTVLPRTISFSACRSILCTDPGSMNQRPPGGRFALTPRRSSKGQLEPELNLSRGCHGLEDASRVRSWNAVPARVTAEDDLFTVPPPDTTGSCVYMYVAIA